MHANGKRCEYAWCKDPAVGELDAGGWRMRYDLPPAERHPWWLCEVHLRPGAHPPDLHKHLRRWDAA